MCCDLQLMIRRINCDARVISRNTDYPQYLIQQIKNTLFIACKSQNEGVCNWWLRLYQGKQTKADMRILKWLTEGKKMEEVWIEDMEEGASEREYD